MNRCGVFWGIARYLQGHDVRNFDLVNRTHTTDKCSGMLLATVSDMILFSSHQNGWPITRFRERFSDVLSIVFENSAQPTPRRQQNERFTITVPPWYVCRKHPIDEGAPLRASFSDVVPQCLWRFVFALSQLSLAVNLFSGEGLVGNAVRNAVTSIASPMQPAPEVSSRFFPRMKSSCRTLDVPSVSLQI